TKDPRMKQLAQNWLSDVRALAAEQASTQTPAPKPTAPATTPAPARELVADALAKERDQLQREFAAREKSLQEQHQRALDALKDELRKLKTTNTELQDKVEELTQERNALAERLKKAGNLRDIADVFANTSYTPTDRERELTQMLAEARKEADTWRASVQNLERTAQQNAEQLVRLRQQLAEAQRGISSVVTGTTAAAELAALRKENAELKHKLQALQSTAGATAAAQAAARAGLTDLSEEITKMQQTIEYQKALLARRDARIAQLEAVAAGQSGATTPRTSDANIKELINELNRQLVEKDRQIAQLQASQRTSQPAAPPDLLAELQRKDQLLREYAARIQQLERQQLASAQPSRYPSPPPYATSPSPPTTPSGAPLYQPLGYSDVYRTPSPPSVPPPPPTYAQQTSPTSPTPPRPYARPPRAYRVRRGDTLASIAQRLYGDRNKWNIIFAANRDILRRADYLREGQILYIPPQ
ncbi:MAG: LysM peptidoglycan-binding domain-containing protein, partial [bacterium]|nr:LysM peptidoglycan-binding domain-containing protein [bacterium]